LMNSSPKLHQFHHLPSTFRLLVPVLNRSPSTLQRVR
jgi:hypothetical protein